MQIFSETKDTKTEIILVNCVIICYADIANMAETGTNECNILIYKEKV